jgi:hypothetical protein
MRRKNFQIYKSHGGTEPFSRSKLFASLKRSGLPEKECRIIADRVSQEVGEGSKTRDIYRKSLSLVKQRSPVAAVHYSLKRSLFDLGPTGHHFETFVAKYFEKIGHETSTCALLRGKFVKHEVDVVCHKAKRSFFVECKFHNRMGIKNDIKIALYVKARWDDLKDGPDGKNLDAFYLASNTSFSSDALIYAAGTGLRLLGLNAPVERPFIEEIKAMGLYPVTSLRRLNRGMLEVLLEHNVVLAREVPAHINLLYRMGMKEQDVDALLGDIELLRGHLL